MADAKWLDDAPDAAWLDDAPDVDEKVPQRTQEAPGKVETGIRGAMQGASFGWSDEGAAAVDAALPGLSRGVDPDVLAAAPQDADYATRYEAAREHYRQRNAEAAGENPKTFLAGLLGGGVASVGGAVKGAKAAPLLVRALRSGATGAATGGGAGAGASESDTAGGVLRDAAGGAMVGGAVGGAIPMAGAALRQTLAKYAPTLGTKAVEQGRKALSGIGTPLAARKPISEDAVRQALDSGAIKPFGTVTGAAERLGTQAETLGDEYGAILRELEAQGVTGPNAIILAQKIRGMAATAKKNLALGGVDTMERTATALDGSVPSAPFASKRLPLSQAEAMKRNLQREANYQRLTDTASAEAKKEMASSMREAIEDSIASQATKAPAEAAKFLPVKQALARTLEARKAAEEGAARASRRKTVGLTDTIVGTGAGVVTGNPLLGVAGAAAHGIADRRLASTNAVLLRALEKAAAKAGRKAPGGATVPAVTAEQAALLDVLGLRAAGAMAEEDDTRKSP